METKVSDLNPGTTGHRVDKLASAYSRKAEETLLGFYIRLRGINCRPLSLEQTCNLSIPNLCTLHKLKPAAAEATSEWN